MEDNLLIPGWEDDEYKAFVEKFKAKKTTDDCYTPPHVYDAVADWVAAEYQADRATFVRPFFPGGDFERFDYPDGCAVVDNPPFSILSKIIAFYHRRQIRYFLFAPALTLFSSSSSSSSTSIPCGVSITYENGAQVPTSFVTNMDDPRIRVRTAPTLYRDVKDANDQNLAETKRSLPRYEYPDNIITAAMCQRWCKYGIDYKLLVSDSLPIGTLDAQRSRGLPFLVTALFSVLELRRKELRRKELRRKELRRKELRRKDGRFRREKKRLSAISTSTEAEL